jgi:hypothetical protein
VITGGKAEKGATLRYNKPIKTKQGVLQGWNKFTR